MSNLSAFDFIAERSEGTPGLWNRAFSAISANIQALNSDLTLNFPSGNTLSIFTGLEVSGGIHAQYVSIGSTPASTVTTAGLVIGVNSAFSDYIHFTDSSGARSDYVIGSRAGGTADGLNIWDASGATMIVGFSKQSVRFYQNVVGSAFDIGGATFNVKGFGAVGNGVADDTSPIQAAIDAASAVGGEVQFPPGTYRVSASGATTALRITSSVLLTGAPGSWIQFPASQDTLSTILRIQASAYTSVNDVRINGVGFDGNNVRRMKAVEAIYTKNLLVQGCRFKNIAGVDITQSAYAIYSSGSTAPTPPSPFPWSTFTRTPLGWTSDTRILECSFSSCSGSDSIFVYWTDGATIFNNTANDVGKLIYVMGWNRHVSITGNVVEDCTDNGIRLGADESILSTDPRDMDGVSLIANVIRSSNRDGIRFSANKSTVVANVSSRNTLSGIAGVVCLDSVIANNVCTDNLNHGIQFTQSTVTGWGTHRNLIIANNQVHRNAGRGIIVQGGGDSSRSACRVVKIRGNSASFNSLDGIAMFDGDDTCEVVENTCWSNGSVGNASGVFITNDLMGSGTGGQLVSWNRCFDSRSTVSAFQIFGISHSGLTAGSAQTGLRLFYNDLSGTTSTITSSGRGIDLTQGSGTKTGALLLGNTVRQPIDNVYLVNSADTLILFNEVGSIQLEDGSAVFPTYAFSSETSLGFYRSGTSGIAQSYGTFGVATIQFDNFQGNSTTTMSIISSILVRRASAGDGITVRHVTAGNYEIRHLGAGTFTVGSDNGSLILSAGTSTDEVRLVTGSGSIRQTLRSGGTVDFSSSVWITSGISLGTGGTIIPAMSSMSSLVGAFVVQGSSSSFTGIAWPAAALGDIILVGVLKSGAVSSISSGLVPHSHVTVAGQIEFRLSNVSTLVQQQSAQTWVFTRISPF